LSAGLFSKDLNGNRTSFSLHFPAEKRKRSFVNDALGRSLAILAWMVLPVVAGFVLWRIWLSRLKDGHALASRIARTSSQASIVALIPPMAMLVFWNASLPAGPSAALPFLGLTVHLLGGAAGWLLARSSGFDRPVQGACFLGGASSNVLTFGGIVAVLLLSTPEDPHGEQALGAMQLYRVLEAPFYYLVAWPVAAYLSSTGPQASSWGATFRRSFRPVTLLPLAGMGVGVLLNLAKIHRPGLLDGVSSWFVRGNVLLLGVTVGLTLRRAAVGRQLSLCLGISAIKFALLPCAAAGALWLLGFRGLHLQTALVCASMPVAFMAVVGANLVGLDEEVLGSLWLFTTAAMVVIVPLLAVVVPRLA
jgi:predicted permease